MARQGKIARLPHALKEQVCLRMLNGESATVILDWLNAKPEAVKVWRQLFKGEPASEQNLSNWRLAGYAEWEARREKTESLKTLGAFALDLSKAGGNLADGAAAIVAGQILEVLENSANIAITGGSDDAEADPLKGLVSMAKAVSALQAGSAAKAKVALASRKADQTDESLRITREKMEKQTITMFLKWAASKEAQDILNSGKSKTVQMDLLRALMFGPVKP